MLAPMEGYTDAALRTLCFRHGADLTFTEMAYVSSLLRGNHSTLARVTAHDSTPVQIQLLTAKEDELKQFLNGFRPFPGFKGFNLNLSCPSLEVIKQGKGAALIKRVTKTEKLASTIRLCGYNVSIKMRLGTNSHEKSLKVYLNCLRRVDAEFFVIHSKTASQGSSEPADYSVYPECVEAASGRPVIANGDIDSVEKISHLREMGVAGVMVGRAALRDPSIFDSLKNGLGLNSPTVLLPRQKKLEDEYLTLSNNIGSEKYNMAFMRVLGRKGGVIY